MRTGEEIKNALVRTFAFLTEKVRVQREKRIWADAPLEHFREVFDCARKELGFTMLCTITGVDDAGTMGAIYHMASEDGQVLSIKVSLAKEKPSLKSVTDVFPAADLYERELVDLFGVAVEGLPKGKRYPLPDDWPEGQHPLKKDWQPGQPGRKEETPHA
ncbi:MAG: NADH-quinone oxidoreductase subunit C [Candidatus Omnitrophica bacterium]|nr:NADH-quinone oxidoreductase subunit C [Candidatus Omnitrophota bacterium]